MQVLRRELCVQCRVVLYRVSRSFSVRVPRDQQVLVGRVHHYVPVSAVPCIRHAQPRWGHVRLALAQGFRLRAPFVQVAVRVRPRVVRDSAMFRVA